MKKLMMLNIAVLLLSGCGLKVVKKQDLLDGIDKAKAAVDQTCASSPGVYSALDQLIESLNLQ